MIRSPNIDPKPVENEHDIQSDSTFQKQVKNVTPLWLRELKESNWAYFKELPLPTKETESWRFAKTDDLSPKGYSLASGNRSAPSNAIPPSEDLSINSSGKIELRNDSTLNFIEAHQDFHKKGLIWMTLEDAQRHHPDILQEYLPQVGPNLGSEKYQALHAAFVQNGTLLYVPPGLEIKLPFITSTSIGGQNLAGFPCTLVIADTNSSVDLEESFHNSPGSSSSLVCATASIFARQGSRVSYKALQNWGMDTISFHLNSVTADRDAEVKTVALNLGSSHTRNEQHTRIVGEGCNVENYSISVPTGEQELDQRTLQSHYAPNSRSNLLFKNALSDSSRSIFSGLIKVDEIAQQTNAYQTNRNLLLSSEAEANALPGLEILANDVRCSHGATTGKIDDEQLYYLRARGIRKPLAQELLVFGFLEEVITKVESEKLQNQLRELIRRKLQDQ
ncbi:MAG: hypothetical protein DF168_00070 [Candidatus Moanabacter tarae]|uniref:FeS cluster assembly protein SufD n=1 Tax=Candidatus Moanibacter tarae TaxID=2200854 RepID=A0A2Z4ADD6_9BACT|nr:MAG: hypothetical protein DF168_00070 [Candidatus Moanabacter tarae]|tara:strand:- start:29194 stop:30537 length:1344 start_codon:yes stop_codon:yes gene_type:complete